MVRLEEYFEGCLDADWYPGLDREHLLINRGVAVSEQQEVLPMEPPRWPLADECILAFGPFRDAGDRALIRTALRAGIPMILTTDLQSLWQHRRSLYPLGIEVWRPTDLWSTLSIRAA